MFHLIENEDFLLNLRYKFLLTYVFMYVIIIHRGDLNEDNACNKSKAEHI